MLRTGGGVNRPSVAFDADASRYVISWTSNDGKSYVATVADIVAVAESGEPIDIAEAVVTAESSRSCDCNIPNAVPGNVIAVTEEEASKLIERFGRIYNVETSVATQHIDMAASRKRPVKPCRHSPRSAPISSTATVLVPPVPWIGTKTNLRRLRRTPPKASSSRATRAR